MCVLYVLGCMFVIYHSVVGGISTAVYLKTNFLVRYKINMVIVFGSNGE